MIETNYYAKVKYRGKETNYFIGAEENNDIRLHYLDYKPERWSDLVWFNNGKDKIVEIYEKGSKEFNYYEDVNTEMNYQSDLILNWYKKRYQDDYVSLGTDHYIEAWRKAVNKVNIKSGLKLFPDQYIKRYKDYENT